MPLDTSYSEPGGRHWSLYGKDRAKHRQVPLEPGRGLRQMGTAFGQFWGSPCLRAERAWDGSTCEFLPIVIAYEGGARLHYVLLA